MSSAAKTAEFRTADLALATFLSLNGRSFRLHRVDDRTAHFIFESVTQDEEDSLKMLVHLANTKRARVEPYAWMREVGSVRGQLYDFLDGKRTA